MLDLFQELQREIGFACLFISHDLAVVEILAQSGPEKNPINLKAGVTHTGPRRRDALLRGSEDAIGPSAVKITVHWASPRGLRGPTRSSLVRLARVSDDRSGAAWSPG